MTALPVTFFNFFRPAVVPPENIDKFVNFLPFIIFCCQLVLATISWN